METLPQNPPTEQTPQLGPDYPIVQVAEDITMQAAGENVDNPIHSTTAVETLTKEPSRLRQLGRAALVRTGLEVVGAGIDIALMGAGSAGVSFLGEVANREIAASAIDNVLLSKVSPEEVSQHEQEKSRARRIGAKVLKLSMGIGAAVAGQKYGPEFVNHIASNLNHGSGEIIVPLASKVGALAGVTKAQKRFGI